MKIYELTKPELDMFREMCNFTPDELTFFNEKARYRTNLQISLENHWSESKTVSLSRSVKEKIKRIKADF